MSKRETEENVCYRAKGGKGGGLERGSTRGEKKFVETKFEDEN